MTPEQIIIQILESASAVTAVISDRIYVGYAPQDVAMPFLVIQRDSTEPDHHLLGASGLRRVDFSMSVYGPRVLVLTNLAKSIESALDTANDRTTVGGVNVRRIWMEDQNSSTITLADGTGTPIHVVEQNYYMHYQED